MLFQQVTAHLEHLHQPIKTSNEKADRAFMLRKTLRKELVCWTHPVPRGAVADAKIIEPGETAMLRDNEDPRGTGRMTVIVQGEILFCDRKQFWDAAG
jgi:hypothetical protein